MKRLHRADLYGWSEFNEARNIDFHSLLWAREEGNIMVDPLSLSDHDKAHVLSLGEVAYIVITNSDHVRDAEAIAEMTGAKLLGPIQEREQFPIACHQWLSEGDEIVPGLRVFELEGSKTPGELALLLEDQTLITGDLIRAHEGGKLCLLPDAKLSDRTKAIASVKRMASLADIETVLTGDGWPVFRDGRVVLQELLEDLETA